MRESTLEEGDQVLVRNVRLRNKHKLADKWESTVYRVLRKMGDLPVYTVEPIGGDGPIRTLHRDLLLPCGDLCEAEEVEPTKPKAQRPRTRQSQQPPEENLDSEDDQSCYSFPPSVIPEKHFFEVLEVPLTLQPTVTPASLLDELNADHPVVPLEPVREPLVAVEIEEPEGASEQLPMEEEVTLPDVTSETSVAVDRETSSVTPESHGTEAAVDIQQSTDQDNTQTHIETYDNSHDEASDTTRRSERTRRPPGRFHYPELGTPLISFAQIGMKGLMQSQGGRV